MEAKLFPLKFVIRSSVMNLLMVYIFYIVTLMLSKNVKLIYHVRVYQQSSALCSWSRLKQMGVSQLKMCSVARAFIFELQF